MCLFRKFKKTFNVFKNSNDFNNGYLNNQLDTESNSNLFNNSYNETFETAKRQTEDFLYLNPIPENWTKTPRHLPEKLCEVVKKSNNLKELLDNFNSFQKEIFPDTDSQYVLSENWEENYKNFQTHLPEIISDVIPSPSLLMDNDYLCGIYEKLMCLLDDHQSSPSSPFTDPKRHYYFNHHQIQINSNQISIFFLCPICSKTLTHYDQWSQHLHSHLITPQFQCPFCLESLADSDSSSIMIDSFLHLETRHTEQLKSLRHFLPHVMYLYKKSSFILKFTSIKQPLEMYQYFYFNTKNK